MKIADWAPDVCFYSVFPLQWGSFDSGFVSHDRRYSLTFTRDHEKAVVLPVEKVRDQQFSVGHPDTGPQRNSKWPIPRRSGPLPHLTPEDRRELLYRLTTGWAFSAFRWTPVGCGCRRRCEPRQRPLAGLRILVARRSERRRQVRPFNLLSWPTEVDPEFGEDEHEEEQHGEAEEKDNAFAPAHLPRLRSRLSRPFVRLGRIITSRRHLRHPPRRHVVARAAHRERKQVRAFRLRFGHDRAPTAAVDHRIDGASSHMLEEPR